MKADWLARLAPAHAPPAPGWWPPAPGWWAITVLCLLLAAALAWWWREPQRARRRIALRELLRIRAAVDIDAAASARAIENLLRRYAIALFGRAHVARLTGEAWLRFAARHGGGSLAGDTGRSLLSAAFGGTVEDRREQWLAAATDFVRRARAPREPLPRGPLPRGPLSPEPLPRERGSGGATR